jgi:hypothetical protein
VWDEAERLGLAPIPAGATVWLDERTDSLLVPTHVRLADGRWLEDLTKEQPADGALAKRSATLVPYSGPTLRRWLDQGRGITHELELRAWALHQGDADAFVGWQPDALDWRAHNPGWYPRTWEGHTLEEQMRGRFASEAFKKAETNVTEAARWSAAGTAILPANVRPGILQAEVRRTAARALPTPRPLAKSDATPTDPWEALIRIDFSHTHIGWDLVPGVSDDTLIALIADRRVVPGNDGAALGDRALTALRGRWGFDPALAARRPLDAPWDDAERDAVAAGIRAWWTATAGMNLEERFATLVLDAPLDAIAMTLRVRRFPRAASQKPTIHERIVDLRPDTFTAAVMPVLATRLRRGGDGVEPEALRDLLHVCADQPAINAALASWPRSGAHAFALAEWDDLHDQPATYDRLMSDWFAGHTDLPPWIPRSNVALFFGCENWEQRGFALRLGLPMGWVQRPAAERWRHMQNLLSRDQRTANEDLFAIACGTNWGDALFFPGIRDSNMDMLEGLRCPLAWLALGDTRPLPAHFRTAFQPIWDDATMPPAEDLRWCDAALGQIRANNIQWMFMLSRSRTLWFCSPLSLPRTERDALIVPLRAQLAPLARAVLDRYHLEVPPDLAACTTPTPITTSGLTADESRNLTRVLQTAVELGFPDLTDATVHGGGYQHANGSDQEGLHFHLADGRWLLPSGEIISPDALRTPDSIVPMPTTFTRPNTLPFGLETAGQIRVGLNRIGSFAAPIGDDARGPVLAAVAWWRSGTDADGHILVNRLLGTWAEQRMGATPRIALPSSSGADRRPQATPTLVALARRQCATFFRERAAEAANRSETLRWIEAARAIIDPSERPTWEPCFAGLMARWDIPATVPPDADLITRLRSWDHQNPRSGAKKKYDCPATRDDTAALIALLADGSPSRWLDERMPRTMGDNALRALNDIWRCDWRLVACSDPATAAALQAQTANWHTGGLPLNLPWTPECRHAVATSLQRWWSQPEHHSDAAIYAAQLSWLPVSSWRNLALSGDLDPLIADTATQVLRALPALGRDGRAWAFRGDGLASFVLCFPTHTGLSDVLAAWPDSPDLTALHALRTAMAGGTSGIDAWFTAAWDNHSAPLHARHLSMAEPGNNLGLLTAQPTIARRDRLLALLGLPVADPVFQTLFLMLGQPTYGRWDDRSPTFGFLAPVHAIPAALAAAALLDTRPVPDAVTQGDLHRSGSRDTWEDLDGITTPRICDWTAAHLIQQHKAWTLDPLPVGVDNDPNTFLKRPVAERDKAIAILKDLMQDVVRETAEKAGWITTKTQDAGNRF